VVSLLALAVVLAASGPVRVGPEVVREEEGGALRGRRVGLLTHAAALTADGRHAVDVLRGSGVEVVRLFAPEHGLRSRAAAGEKLGSGTDPASGLPVVSLYGEKDAPAREDLAGLEALVVDLQDAGVRFYTYASTMLLSIGAAWRAGLPVVVLDRPNPLGGVRLEGPLRASPEVVPWSLVSRAPGPLVHGLTLGEMARLAARGRPGARLSVVAMKGWRREMTWEDTGRPWVPPSPNLRTAEAALAYPGTCLLEATTVSEGRGTDAPFLVLGAPWLDPWPLTRLEVPGFRLEAITFRTRASEAAPRPKHLEQESRGVRVRVVDSIAAAPYALGVRLLHALRRQAGFAWTSEGALDRLLGTPRVREALERGASPEEILGADRPAIAAFREERKAALLY
jgi:uncharacterized protein YbbC (DUF1343 family)